MYPYILLKCRSVILHGRSWEKFFARINQEARKIEVYKKIRFRKDTKLLNKATSREFKKKIISIQYWLYIYFDQVLAVSVKCWWSLVYSQLPSDTYVTSGTPPAPFPPHKKIPCTHTPYLYDILTRTLFLSVLSFFTFHNPWLPSLLILLFRDSTNIYEWFHWLYTVQEEVDVCGTSLMSIFRFFFR